MMIIVEPHIHMTSRTTDDYQRMYTEGIRVCVEPAFWLGQPRHDPGAFFHYFDWILDFETERARRFGIEHYAAIAVNPKEADHLDLAGEVLDELAPYLDHERCVAVGETGLNLITEHEEQVFREHLDLAVEREMLVLIHSPHDKPDLGVSKAEGVKRTVAILRELDCDLGRVCIDHNTEATIALSRELPVWTGLTVYPYSKLNPERVAAIVRRHGLERMLVNSSADWGVSDPCSLARVAEHMRAQGFGDGEIQTLLFDNPMAFYRQCDRFKPDLDLKPVPVEEFQR
jgi:predicted metal-dependent TIM-barrel fold hydrolase